MDDLEPGLAIVQRHLQEAEARPRRLKELAVQGQYPSTDLTAKLIETMQQSVALAREHVAWVEKKPANRHTDLAARCVCG